MPAEAGSRRKAAELSTALLRGQMTLRHEVELQKRLSHSFAYNKQQSILLLLPASIARTRDYQLLTGFHTLGKKKANRCTSSLRTIEELKTRDCKKRPKIGMQWKEKKRGERVQTTRSQWTKKGMEEQLRAAEAGTKVTFNNKDRSAGKVHGTSHRAHRLQ